MATFHQMSAFFLLLIGLYCKDIMLDFDYYSTVLHLVYHLVLIWLVYFYLVSEVPSKVKETNYEVCIVGTGFSGIGAAVKLKEIGVKFRIIEKAQHLGGVWWSNQYPGCGCDIFSHVYSFSFHPNPDWNRSHAEQPEVLKYLETVAKQHGVSELIEYNKQVQEMTWNEQNKKWNIRLNNGEEFEANAIICGVGVVSIPTIPDFKGKDKFKGETFHSAELKIDDYFEGKKVAVIGTGASSVQIVPTIAGKVEHLYVFQRSAPWVLPKVDFSYPGWMKWIFRVYRPAMYLHRFMIFWIFEFGFGTIWRVGGLLQQPMTNYLLKYLQKIIKDPSTAKKLVPDYVLGCKRVTFSNNYQPTFNRSNVTLITDPIEQITEDGIQTKDGTIHELDAIIYATGFSPSKGYRTFKTVGLNDAMSIANQNKDHRYGTASMTKSKMSLQEEWDDQPNAYMGITCPGYPNIFFLLGPGSLLSHSSFIFMIECAITYAVDAIKTMIAKDIKSINLKKEVSNNYQIWRKKKMSNKVFVSPTCTSWYRNKKGINYTIWPTHLTTYWWKTRKINLDDYDCN